MNSIIEISHSERKRILVLSDEQARTKYGKGWSMFFIYHLRELRDIYNACIETCSIKPSVIYQFATKNIDRESSEKDWNERFILEHINALKNLELINVNNEPTKSFNFSKLYNKPLTQQDKEIFINRFFHYHRFNEISNWFLGLDSIHNRTSDMITKDILFNRSTPLYFFSDKSRFTDSFVEDIDKKNPAIYFIDEEMSHLMRFWDVYLKWGTTLGILDKFSLSKMHFKTIGSKDISMVYFVNPFKTFNLMDFLKINFRTRHIWIPELIFRIVKAYRFSVNEIKDFLITEISNDDRLTYERTSQIFLIKGKTSIKKIEDATYLYPIINDSYVSHLTIRK